MKCYVCGMDHVSREDGECPDCGFQMASMSGAETVEEYEEAVKEMAEEYRELYRRLSPLALWFTPIRRTRQEKILSSTRLRKSPFLEPKALWGRSSGIRRPLQESRQEKR